MDIRGRFAGAGKYYRHYFRTLSTGGQIMALLFFCFSMTPSLLPRPWYLQGIASGISVVLGYTVGVMIGALLRFFGFRALQKPAHRRLINRVTLVAAIILIPLFGVLGAMWQHQVRDIIGADLNDPNYYALTLLIAFVFARVVIMLARVIRNLTRRLGRFGGRWIPLPVAKLLATVLVSAFLLTIFTDTLLPPITRAANSSFALTDTGTAPGIHQPVEPERSGSAASLVRWDDLGREGRNFIARGPRAADIAAFSGSAASEPIRVYAGADSATTVAGAADLVVDELVRTGAFDRSVIVIATTTGRGWINEVAAESVEYMWDGDTAIASLQYSYLPSPVAFVADRSTPPDAAAALFDAVIAELDRLPAHKQPLVAVMGESLGAYGSESVFDGLHDVVHDVDAALWVGTPNFTPLWRSLTDRRDDASLEQIPDIDDCQQVCFAAHPDDIPAGAQPSVLFVQHVNDPIVWWSPRLLFNEPDWLKEPAPAGRNSNMRWAPLVTFWQVAMDMIFSADMPAGTGHHYGVELVNAFAAVLPPPNWTAADTERLRNQLIEVDVS